MTTLSSASDAFVPRQCSEEEVDRILVIDDTPAIHDDIRAVLGKSLSDRAGLAALEADLFGDTPLRGEQPTYLIDSAFQGREGVELAATAVNEGRFYGLAFVDMRMPPGWDGLKTIGHLWEVDPDLEVVICTAYTEHDLDRVYEIADAPDQLLILKKPFDAMEVRQLARSLSVKRRMRAEARARMEGLEAEVAERTRELIKINNRLQHTLEERDRLGVELHQAQKIEAVGQLAAGIAHEINTPIQFVGDSVHFLAESFGDLVGLLEALRGISMEDPATPLVQRRERIARAEETADYAYLHEQIPSAISRAAAGVERVAAIVRAMKEFGHPDEREKTRGDLNHVIANALTVSRHEYKYVADVETEFAQIPELPMLVGEMGQVFLNLIVNAAHAISDKVAGTSGRGLITVKTELEEGFVHASIRDTGGGISDAVIHRIFDPFFTTKEVGRGTGQGLSIARSSVVDKHGGTITAESEVGVGTVFHVRIPLTDSVGEP